MSPTQNGCLVCVCTYERPIGLKRTLESLVPQKFEDRFPRVLVVDNSETGTASEIVAEMSGFFTQGVLYSHVASRGLVNARNAALEATNPGECLVFIDDDERASSNWLNSLWETHLKFPEAVVAGPVRAVSDMGRWPSWGPEGEWWQRKSFEDQERITWLAPDGNILLPAVLVGDSNWRYDAVFNTFGAQDSHLFARWLASGRDIYWAAGGAVDEFIPSSRISKKYVYERARWSAMGYVLVERRLGRGVWRAIPRICWRVSRGTTRLSRFVLTRSAQSGVAARSDFGAAVGTFEGLLGRTADRYVGYQSDSTGSRLVSHSDGTS